MLVMTIVYHVNITQEDGSYIATVPLLPGCHTFADSYEQAVEMIGEAISLYVESLIAHGEAVPQETAHPSSLFVNVPVHA